MRTEWLFGHFYEHGMTQNARLESENDIPPKFLNQSELNDHIFMTHLSSLIGIQLIHIQS